MNIFSKILILSAVLSFICAVIGRERKQTKGGVYFSLLMLSSAVYSLGYAFQLETKSLPEILFWTKIQYLGISFIPYLWFLFALYFVGYEKVFSYKRNLILLTIPVITVILVLTMEKHSLYYISFSVFQNIPLGVIKIERGVWYWVHQIFSYCLIIAGGLIFLSMYYRSTRPYRKQAITALVGSVIPLLAYTIYLLGYSPYSIDLIPFAITISGTIYLYALTHQGFLKLIPISRDVVFENMMGSVLVFDKDNHLVDFNPRAKTNFNFINDDFVGQHVRDIFKDYEQIIDSIVLLDKNNNMPNKNISLGNKTFSATFSVVVDSKNRTTGKLLILNDITDFVIIENKLRQNSENLEKLINEKNRFFSIIAHDLRGPFQGFLGLSGILAEDAEVLSKDEIKDISQELNKALVTQYSFLEELLQWAGLNTNRIDLNLVKFDLYDIVNSITNVLQNNAVAKNISVEVICHNNIWITADKDMIKLVIRNLLSNAIKFSRLGGRITITLEEADNFAVVAVKDDGVGISETNLSQIFSAGSHLSTEGTAKERGSGLGLILCKEIIDKHRGKIWAESEIGKGSIFKVKIPLPQGK
jgi:signal transduction histidine kinase